MNVKSANRENNKLTVNVEIESEVFEAGINKAYLKNRKYITVPGFRKGKAPRKMIENLYGAQVFHSDAVEEIFPDVCKEAVLDQGWKTVGQPSVTDMNVRDDKSLELTIETELYPEVELGQYKGVEAPKAAVAVTDEMVEAELDRKANEVARIVTVERPAQEGDTVVIDYKGLKDGVAFDGGTAEGYELRLGSHTFIPGFEDQLIGMQAGEEKDIDITFPENYTPELAGKPVVFHVKVNEVKVKEVPALDDEFAKDVSEFDTLKELKADLKKKITEERTKAAQRAFEDVLMDKVAEGIEADIPQEMIDAQAENMLNNLKQQLASQGLTFEQYTQFAGGEEKVKAEAAEPALRQVRMDLAVEAIKKAENLECSDEEIAAEMKKIADQYNMDLENVRKYLRAEDVKDQLLREKVIRVVADSAVAVAPAEESEKKEETEEKTEE